MDLYQIGLTGHLQSQINANKQEGFALGRVMKQHKDRYEVWTAEGKVNAEITGKLRFTATSSHDFPAVGDWVWMLGLDDLFLIHEIVSRQTILERKSVGEHGETQLIATNIDTALIVQALDDNFNLNRLERYVSMAYAGKIRPVVVLNKLDLISDSKRIELETAIKNRIRTDIELIWTSAVTNEGIPDLIALFETGQTYCLLGSSGVGKSTLINTIAGKELLETAEISSANFKGRHTTTHREIILLSGGGLLMDTPGMRELGMADSSQGIAMTFDQIQELSRQCKFNNCSHTQEDGCAILAALESGELETDSWENYQKLERESRRFEASKAERRKKDKQMGKLYKQIIQSKRKNKY